MINTVLEDLFRKIGSSSLTTTDKQNLFVVFILGGYDEDSDESYRAKVLNLSPSTLYRLYKGKIRFDDILDEHFFDEMFNTKLSYKTLKSLNLIDDTQITLSNLAPLCRKYEIDSQAENPESLLITLLYECRMVCSHVFIPQAARILRKGVIDSTLVYQNALLSLTELLKSSKGIILSGLPGSGKTRLAEILMTKLKKTYDFCYLCCEATEDTSAERVIGHIKEQMKQYIRISGGSPDTMPKRFEDAVLIVDDFIVPDKIREEVAIGILNMGIRVILISIEAFTVNGYKNYHVEPLDREGIEAIINNESKCELVDTNLTRLVEMAEGNPFLALLYGKYIGKNCKSQKKSCRKGVQIGCADLIKLLENAEKRSIQDISKQEITFKTLYDNQSGSIFQHIRKMYDNFLKTDEYNKNHFIEVLCCFGTEPIQESFLRIIFPTGYKSLLKRCCDIGFVTLDYGLVHVRPSLVYSVTAGIPVERVMAIRDQSGIVLKMTDFLHNYGMNLSVPYLGEILVTFAITLDKSLPLVTNRGRQKSASIYFERWQELLLEIDIYYQDFGKLDQAMKVSSLETFPKGLTHHITRPQKKMYDLLRIVSSGTRQQEIEYAFKSFEKEINLGVNNRNARAIEYGIRKAFEWSLFFYLEIRLGDGEKKPEFNIDIFKSLQPIIYAYLPEHEPIFLEQAEFYSSVFSADNSEIDTLIFKAEKITLLSSKINAYATLLVMFKNVAGSFDVLQKYISVYNKFCELIWQTSALTMLNCKLGIFALIAVSAIKQQYIIHTGIKLGISVPFSLIKKIFKSAVGNGEEYEKCLATFKEWGLQ